MDYKTFIKLSLVTLIVSGVISTVQAQSGSSISLVNSVPYSQNNDIRNKVINECTTLGSKLSKFTQSYSKKKGIEISLLDSVSVSGAGKVLQLEITDAVSQGNAFIGHRKFVEVKGSLWQDGKKIASFDGQRSSGGGFGAAYKGSCSVLGRCVKTLGKDIAGWLANPKDGASLGD